VFGLALMGGMMLHTQDVEPSQITVSPIKPQDLMEIVRAGEGLLLPNLNF